MAPFDSSTQRDGVGFVHGVRDSSDQFMNELFPLSKERHLVPENVSTCAHPPLENFTFCILCPKQFQNAHLLNILILSHVEVECM